MVTMMMEEARWSLPGIAQGHSPLLLFPTYNYGALAGPGFLITNPKTTKYALRDETQETKESQDACHVAYVSYKTTIACTGHVVSAIILAKRKGFFHAMVPQSCEMDTALPSHLWVSRGTGSNG